MTEKKTKMTYEEALALKKECEKVIEKHETKLSRNTIKKEEAKIGKYIEILEAVFPSLDFYDTTEQVTDVECQMLEISGLEKDLERTENQDDESEFKQGDIELRFNFFEDNFCKPVSWQWHATLLLAHQSVAGDRMLGTGFSSFEETLEDLISDVLKNYKERHDSFCRALKTYESIYEHLRSRK